MKKPTATFKAGKKVSHLVYGEGKIEEVLERANGQWLVVKFGSRKDAVLKTLRQATLTLV